MNTVVGQQVVVKGRGNVVIGAGDLVVGVGNYVDQHIDYSTIPGMDYILRLKNSQTQTQFPYL